MKSLAWTVACVTAVTLSLAACSQGIAVETTSPSGHESSAQPLSIDVYNPGEKGIFSVASVLVSGNSDAVLIDAQFSTADAQNLVKLIRAGGKRLTTVYISHGDPDFYFGLETVKEAFPGVEILATPQTVAHIKETSAGKLAYWGPILAGGAPKRVIVPEPVEGDLELEGQRLQVVGLEGPTPERTFVWIPSIKTVVGGIPVVAGEHVWMADTQTAQSHADWLATLAKIESLEPARVVPGHFAPSAEQDLPAVRFTAGYIQAYDEETPKAESSTELVAAMKRRYPSLAGLSSLELSAKVTKGEMKWP